MAQDGKRDPGFIISEEDSDTCLVAFAAMPTAVTMPPFELMRVSDGLPVVRMLLRDLEQSWYLRGISGLGDDVASTVDALRTLLEERGVTRTVCFGNSAGGYAALQYGSLLGADVIYAFAAQTNMNKAFWDRNQLKPALPQTITLWESAAPSEPGLDLRPIVEAGAVPVHLYYSTGVRKDTIHAEHLADLPNVCLHPRKGTEHGLARIMRDNGELRAILVASVTP